jgi:hypothetical protein
MKVPDKNRKPRMKQSVLKTMVTGKLPSRTSSQKAIVIKTHTAALRHAAAVYGGLEDLARGDEYVSVTRAYTPGIRAGRYKRDGSSIHCNPACGKAKNMHLITGDLPVGDTPCKRCFKDAPALIKGETGIPPGLHVSDPRACLLRTVVLPPGGFNTSAEFDAYFQKVTDLAYHIV